MSSNKFILTFSIYIFLRKIGKLKFMYMFEIIIIYVMFFILSRKVLATYQKHQTDNYKGAYELPIPHVTHLHFYTQYIPILYNSSIMVITHFYLFVHLRS